MLCIVIPGEEYFDEEKQEFNSVGDFVLELEHSLISLSKWESKFQKPFLSTDDKTQEEFLGYVEAMILNPIYPKDVLRGLTKENWDQINDYLDSSQSATTFGIMPQHKSRGEVVTSELIYYWLVAFSIPFECEKWHLNRLLALVKICNIKNNSKNNKKMSKSELSERYRALNAQRRAKYNTSG
jgi:hypothetical protein